MLRRVPTSGTSVRRRFACDRRGHSAHLRRRAGAAAPRARAAARFAKAATFVTNPLRRLTPLARGRWGSLAAQVREEVVGA